MITLPAIAVTGAAITVQVQSQVGRSARWPIRLANESPYQATASIAGTTLVLQPYTADVIQPAQEVAQFGVGFTQLSTPLPAATTSQLVVTIAEPGETIPGTYPMALARQTQSYQSQVLLGTITVPLNSFRSVNFTLPPGVQAVGFVQDETGVNNHPASVLVLGTQTQNEYLSALPTATGGIFVGQVVQGIDTQATFQVTSQAGSQCTVYAIAWTDLPIVFVQQFSGQTLDVIDRPTTSSGNGGGLAAINAGATVTLIPAVAGQAISLWDLDIVLGASAANPDFVVKSSGGQIVGLLGPGQSFQLHRSGVALPSGDSLQLLNQSGVNNTFVWAATFSQA